MWIAAHGTLAANPLAGGSKLVSYASVDGDQLSNNMSWQWLLARCHKPYFFNRENLERYTEGFIAANVPYTGDFEGSYEELERRLPLAGLTTRAQSNRNRVLRIGASRVFIRTPWQSPESFTTSNKSSIKRPRQLL